MMETKKRQENTSPNTPSNICFCSRRQRRTTSVLCNRKIRFSRVFYFCRLLLPNFFPLGFLAAFAWLGIFCLCPLAEVLLGTFSDFQVDKQPYPASPSPPPLRNRNRFRCNFQLILYSFVSLAECVCFLRPPPAARIEHTNWQIAANVRSSAARDCRCKIVKNGAVIVRKDV